MTVFTWANGDSLSSIRTKIINKLSPIIDVKADFGATGDGSTDDASAINAAFDAAFGASDSPHGSTPTLNRPVFFPAGTYRVVSPAALTVSGAVTNGGLIKLTVNSTTGYRTGQIAFVTGVGGISDNGLALGSGGNPVNSNYGITVDDSTHITLRQTTFAGSYTSGGTVTRSGIQTTSVQGGWIFGAGREATKIITGTTNGTAFALNGFQRGRIEGMSIQGHGTGTGLDLDWEGPTGTVLSTQSNRLVELAFASCAYGARLGNHGQQVSENIFECCDWDGCTVAGLAIQNYNALQMGVIGGNFQECAVGILVTSGSCPIIHGVGFQSSAGVQGSEYDIEIMNTVGDGMSVHGCRTESKNFMLIHAGASAHAACNTQLNVTAGVFCFIESGSGVYPGSLTADSNMSTNGTIIGNGKFYGRGNLFLNSSPFSSFTGTIVQNI